MLEVENDLEVARAAGHPKDVISNGDIADVVGTDLEAKIGDVEVVLDGVVVLLVVIRTLPMTLPGSKIFLKSSRELTVLFDGASCVLVQATAVLP